MLKLAFKVLFVWCASTGCTDVRENTSKGMSGDLEMDDVSPSPAGLLYCNTSTKHMLQFVLYMMAYSDKGTVGKTKERV